MRTFKITLDHPGLAQAHTFEGIEADTPRAAAVEAAKRALEQDPRGDPVRVEEAAEGVARYAVIQEGSG